MKLWGPALLCAMALTACDGGMSREEFVSEANAICEETEASLQDLGGEAVNQQDPTEITDVAAEELGNLRDRLEELEPPDEFSDDFATMIQGLEGAIGDIDSLSQAVEESLEAEPQDEAAAEESIAEVQEITESLTANLDEASGAAEAMDLEDCAAASSAGETS
ncbi:MAG: hypothetical protein ACRDK3_00625 [Actinomycetota bacterium]